MALKTVSKYFDVTLTVLILFRSLVYRSGLLQQVYLRLQWGCLTRTKELNKDNVCVWSIWISMSLRFVCDSNSLCSGIYFLHLSLHIPYTFQITHSHPVPVHLNHTIQLRVHESSPFCTWYLIRRFVQFPCLFNISDSPHLFNSQWFTRLLQSFPVSHI
jgi:hypothetical protein